VRVFYVDNVGNVNGPGKVARSESAHRNNLASTVLKRRINECQTRAPLPYREASRISPARPDRSG